MATKTEEPKASKLDALKESRAKALEVENQAKAEFEVAYLQLCLETGMTHVSGLEFATMGMQVQHLKPTRQIVFLSEEDKDTINKALEELEKGLK
jgi:hypothetical protein